ncbi:hypothetical protein [Rufibacter psychrotolerans]|uniref:hypothetical protein n=1 Tax=Rufibacter psychrotolerans TaxID=2812556 RepID=UPI001967392E|nr:hypothetical protein [Rufibacter sp. SYSU D00308]
MENTARDYSHIPGWGIDADPKNDPTYPMKHRTDEEQRGYTWQRPTQQPVTVEVFHSIERPGVSAVFGTSVPPSGLSGKIRRLAFKKSENDYGHWLPLILADRINVVEGIIDDIKNGKFPNIWAEKGMPAEWKHNRSGLMQTAAIGVFLVAAVAAWKLGQRSGSNG